MARWHEGFRLLATEPSAFQLLGFVPVAKLQPEGFLLSVWLGAVSQSLFAFSAPIRPLGNPFSAWPGFALVLRCADCPWLRLWVAPAYVFRLWWNGHFRMCFAFRRFLGFALWRWHVFRRCCFSRCRCFSVHGRPAIRNCCGCCHSFPGTNGQGSVLRIRCLGSAEPVCNVSDADC